MTHDKILFFKHLKEIYPASKAKIYRDMKVGLFPKQIKFGGRVGWSATEVADFIIKQKNMSIEKK